MALEVSNHCHIIFLMSIPATDLFVAFVSLQRVTLLPFLLFLANAAQSETLNYYAQYYAAIAAQQAGGDGPHQQQHGNGSNAQPGPPAAVSAPGGGGGDGQDYTQQWIEYYRAYGMHKEADQIEAMARSSRPGQV